MLSNDVRFGLIGYGVPSEELQSIRAELGERFLHFNLRIKKKSRQEIGTSSINDSVNKFGGKEMMRQELRELVWEFLKVIDGIDAVKPITDSKNAELAELADFLAYARSPIKRKYGEIEEEPIEEVPGRVSTQLAQYYISAKILFGEQEAWHLIHRLIEDSIPITRSKILRKIAEQGYATINKEAIGTKLSTTGLRRHFEDLQVLGVIEEGGTMPEVQGGLVKYVPGTDLSCDAKECLKRVYEIGP